MRPVLIEHWGRMAYSAALERQLALWQARVAGRSGDIIVHVEHPETITLGRNAPNSDVAMSAAELERRGIDFVRSDRGGRATAHGPGQTIVYPIVGIAEAGVGVRRWVCDLERALIDTLETHEIEGRRRDGSPGVWTNRGKIASIGLRVARGVSYHGVALNVGLDAGPFDCILPCGVAGERITSMAEELGETVFPDAVAQRLCDAIAATVAAYGGGTADRPQSLQR